MKNPWRDGDGQGAFAITAIHQYTSHGRISPWTGNLDLDIAYMTKEAWSKYAKGNNQNNSSGGGENASQTITLKPGEKVTIIGGK